MIVRILEAPLPIRTLLWALVAGVVALAPALPGAAQGPRGAGRQLDDPSGAVPPRARERSGDAAGRRAPERQVPEPGRETIPEPGAAATAPSATAPSATAPSAAVRTRLRSLDASFQALGGAGGRNWLGAVFSLLGGGAGIAFGIGFIEAGGDYERMAPYLITLGSVTIARSVLVDLILPPDAQAVAIQFQNMPDATRAERLARLRFGERQLEGLAEAYFISRLVDASFNIAGALAIIPAYLVPNDFDVPNPLEALIFIGPAVSLITGIITLASRSAAERRWDAYRQMRDRLAQGDEEEREERAALVPPAPAGPQLGGGLALDPRGGGVATLTGRF